MNLVRSAAASNLIRLLSSPRNRPSLGPRADAPRVISFAAAEGVAEAPAAGPIAHNDPQFQHDLLAEALRRGRESVGTAVGAGKHACDGSLRVMCRHVPDRLLATTERAAVSAALDAADVALGALESRYTPL